MSSLSGPLAAAGRQGGGIDGLVWLWFVLAVVLAAVYMAVYLFIRTRWGHTSRSDPGPPDAGSAEVGERAGSGDGGEDVGDVGPRPACPTVDR